MCSVTMAMMGGGAIVSAIAAGQQQKAANQQAEYNARLSEREAQINEVQATDAEKRGDKAVGAHRQKIEGIKGSQRASFGASGVTVDKGSTMSTVLDTGEQGELDAMTIKQNAAREAQGYRNNAATSKYEAKASRASKRSTGGQVGMSLLTSGSQMGAGYFSK